MAVGSGGEQYSRGACCVWGWPLTVGGWLQSFPSVHEDALNSVNLTSKGSCFRALGKGQSSSISGEGSGVQLPSCAVSARLDDAPSCRRDTSCVPQAEPGPPLSPQCPRRWTEAL